MIGRREFITLLGGAAAAWPLAARAQQPRRMWRIGSLSPGSSSSQSERLKAFTKELNDLGYIEGRNTYFERRAADGALDHLPALAAELVGANVDVILADTESH